MTMTTSEIECGRCQQKTPGLPGLFDWLLKEAPDDADGKIRVLTALCPPCQGPDEAAIVSEAHKRLQWINDNVGVGGPATMLGDYLECLSGVLSGGSGPSIANGMTGEPVAAYPGSS